MAKRNDDFLSWDDDLDLDFILGEYTDSEYHEDSDDDFDICEDNGQPSAKKVKRSPVKENCKPKHSYTCPICKKVYKSIAGFRGHTSKQHGQHNLKASQHRSDSTNESASNEDHHIKIQFKSVSSVGILKNTFDSIFECAFKSTLVFMKSDPMHNIFGQSDISSLAEHLHATESALEKMKKFFYEMFINVFDESNICFSQDREIVFNKLHQIRIKVAVEKTYLNLFLGLGFSDSVCNNFIQDFLLEFTNQLLQEQVKHEQNSSSTCQAELTENDQKILFYISGYIIRSCHKRYYRLKTAIRDFKLQCVEKMKKNSDVSTFISKYDKWLRKNDRGGLIVPCDDFYLLIRELEVIVRRNIDSEQISAHTLLHDQLKENIFESFMVKYYCNKLFSENDESSEVSLIVLEDIIQVFLTIRGYAVARVERNKFMKENATNKKKSASLRQALQQIKSNQNQS